MEEAFWHAEVKTTSDADNAVYLVGVSVNYFWLLVVRWLLEIFPGIPKTLPPEKVNSIYDSLLSMRA